MNLVIDLGNTFYKLAIFRGDKIVASGAFRKKDIKSAKQFLLKQHNINAAILSSVVNDSPKIGSVLKGIKNKIVFSSQTEIPLKNLYKSPKTLGNDRLAGAVGAHEKFPKRNVLVIDSGTCIKYDFITAKGEYLGGGISPGIEMRFKALHQFTDRLPLIKPDYNYNVLIGKTSENSILSGVLNGAVAEVDGIINRYKKQYSGLKVVITGGNSGFFEKQLKNSIFADPFLVLKGLNAILNYNAKK